MMVLKSFNAGVDRDWQVVVLKSFDVWVETGRWWSLNPVMLGQRLASGGPEIL